MTAIRTLSHAALFGLGLVAATPVPTASACGGVACQPEQFVPMSGSLPVNAPGIRWIPGYDYVYLTDAGAPGEPTDETTLQLRCTTPEGVSSDVAFHVDDDNGARLVVPDQVLVVGDTCELASPCAEEMTTWAGFVVTEEVPLPEGSLGPLFAGQGTWLTQRIRSDDSACFLQQVGVCETFVNIQFTAALRPWASAAEFELLIDGVGWSVDGARVNPEFVPVFAANPQTQGQGLAAGESHTAVMRMTLPGTEIVLTSAPVELTFNCSEQPYLCPGIGFVDASVDTDASALCIAADSVDGSITEHDASVPPATNTAHTKGCSCSAPGPRTSHSLAWLWSLGVIAALGARRVRTSCRRKAGLAMEFAERRG
jgi:MYXO-CTERM domain-containing protein